MTRYIDEKDIYKLLEPTGVAKVHCAQIDELPRADVVPKSEPDRLIDKWIGSGELTPDEKTLRLIEALRDEAKRYERYYFNHEYDKLIGEAKAEAVREIFEEIFTKCVDYYGYIEQPKLAELKKRYESEGVLRRVGSGKR